MKHILDDRTDDDSNDVPETNSSSPATLTSKSKSAKQTQQINQSVNKHYFMIFIFSKKHVILLIKHHNLNIS